jgi:succinyl-diaminopimelate desuccinylase
MTLNKMATRQSLLSEIEENRESYITFLQNFICAASPKPPGDTRDAAQVVIDYLSNHGVTWDVIAPLPHAPNVVTDFDGLRGPGDRVILNGHIDTYPVENPDSWERVPYSGHNDGEKIHGRGGVDMKAGTAASIITFVLLKKRAEEMRGSVALTAVSDEETGGKWGTRYLLEHFGKRWKGDCMLNGEPGGLTSIRFGEKGTLRITFIVKTRGANRAYTHFSRGANILAAQLITKLLDIESIDPQLPNDLRNHFESDEAQRVADDIMGPGAAGILMKPTVNIGVIHGGVKVNTIPEQCAFEADIRLPIGLEATIVLNRIDEILENFPEASYEIQEAASNPANYCTIDHPFARAIAQCALETTGTKPVFLTGLGGTDAKFYRYAGVPTYVYGPSPKGMGGNGEAVSINEFLTLVKTYTLAVYDYLADS